MEIQTQRQEVGQNTYQDEQLERRTDNARVHFLQTTIFGIFVAVFSATT